MGTGYLKTWKIYVNCQSTNQIFHICRKWFRRCRDDLIISFTFNYRKKNGANACDSFSYSVCVVCWTAFGEKLLKLSWLLSTNAHIVCMTCKWYRLFSTLIFIRPFIINQRAVQFAPAIADSGWSFSIYTASQSGWIAYLVVRVISTKIILLLNWPSFAWYAMLLSNGIFVVFREKHVRSSISTNVW